jgi:hypothetical protein
MEIKHINMKIHHIICSINDFIGITEIAAKLDTVLQLQEDCRFFYFQ